MKENKPNTKKAKVLSIIASITLVLFIGGATIAYYTVKNGDDAFSNTIVGTRTTDTLSFSVSNEAINIEATYDNFNNTKGNLSDTITAKALLSANNTTKTASGNYYLYLFIETNTFDYTLGSDKPELLLKVSKDGTPLTVLADGTTQVSVTDNKGVQQTGFDITKTGDYAVITILDNTPINATAENPIVEDVWTIEVMYVNLPVEQNANIMSKLNAKVYISGEEMEFPVPLFNKMLTQFTSNTASIEAEYGIYYHDGSITGTTAGIDTTTDVLDAEDLSYRYAGASYDYTTINTTYESSYTKVDKRSASDTVGLIGMYCGATERYPRYTGTCTDKTYYIVPVGTGITYTDYNDAYAALLDLGLIESVKNYVCFGSDTDTCPAGNLYRIIGAFTFDNGETYNIKLIKNTRYTYAAWDSDYSNTWMRPASIRTTLNGAYLTGLGEWSSLIYQPIWYVGGGAITDKPSKTIYNEEMAATGGSTLPTTGLDETTNKYIDNTGKVGLMYVSDYGYAASPSYWKTNLNNYSSAAKNYGWIYDNYYGNNQWTISRCSAEVSWVLTLSTDGKIAMSGAGSENDVRPVLYLTSNTKVSSGNGSYSNPWRIVL